MRYLLYLMWSVISLIVLILVGVTVLLTVFNDEVEDRLVQNIERVTGRDIVIEGGFGFSFNPRPTFFANDIKMQNAAWGSQPWMLEIDSLQASLSFSGLLQGEIILESVQASKPKILVEKDPVLNTVNWLFDLKKREPKIFKRLAKHLRINSAQIVDAQIRIEVGPIDHFIEVDVINAKTDYFSELIDIEAFGRMHERNIHLNISLENLENMLLREPTITRIDGEYGDVKIAGQGAIRDLLRWQGHDIRLDLSTESLDYLQPWISTKLIQTPRIEAQARFVQDQKWRSAKFEDIKVITTQLDGKTEIAGRVAKLSGWEGIDLEGTLKYPLASIIRWKGLESDTDAIIDAKFALKGNKKDKLGFEILATELKGTGIQARGAGKIEHLLQPDTEGIPFTFEFDSLARIGQINAKQWFNSKALNGTFNLLKKEGKLAINAVKIDAFDGRASLTGALDDIAKTQIGQFQLETNFIPQDIRSINDLNKKQYPAFDRTKINARINMARTDFDSPKMTARMQSKGLLFSLEGAISDLKTLQLNQADISLKSESISDINDQFKINLPDLGAVSATGVLTGNINDLFNINDISANVDNVAQHYRATGNATSLGPDMSAELDIFINASSVKNLPKIFKSEIRIPGDFAADGTAKLLADSLKDWSITQIDLGLKAPNSGSVKGAIRHFPEATDYALSFDLKKINATAFTDMQAVKTIQQENLSAYIELDKRADQAAFSVNNIDAEFTVGAGKGTVRMAGNIGRLHDFSDIDLTLGLSTSDIKGLPYLRNLPFKDNMNGAGTLKLTGIRDKLKMKLEGFQLSGTDFRGELVLTTGSSVRPNISGQLFSDHFDILSLLRKEKRKRMFSDAPLNFGWLNDIDANISIKANRFNWVIAQLSDASIKFLIEDGVLNIPNLNGNVGAGHMSMWFSVVGRQRPYSIVSTFKAEDVKPENLNLFGKSELIRGGSIDVDVGLGGVGESIADYMSNAYGKIQLQLHNSSLKNQNLELFGADLVSGVLGIINPFTKQEDYLSIECGVIHFPVINGHAIAAQGIAIKTDKVTVLGGGAIDLGSEELQLLIKPKARKGLGFSAGTIANIAKISGSFAKPKISLDSRSILQSTAAIGAAIASGGWTLLAQGLLDRNKANSDVCKQTLIEPNRKTILDKAADSFSTEQNRKN